MTRNLDFRQASIGSAFAGQYVNGQITGKSGTAPLSLIPAQDAPDYMPDIPFNSGTYNSNSGSLSVSPAERILFMSNSLVGQAIRENNVITRYNWAYTNGSSGFSRNLAVGINPISILFNDDQAAVGFQVVNLNRTGQQVGSSQTGQPRFRVKFLRRDGALISEVILTPDHDKLIAFARCGGAADIAGIQVTNTTKSGLAFDDFIFGVPRAVPKTHSNEGPLSRLNETQALNNPLHVDLCSFYTS